MVEAFDSLRTSNAEPAQLFVDAVHPNSLGHAKLAEDLFRFLVRERLLPASE